MDIDISDILASVSRPAPGASTPGTPYHDDAATFTDHQLLTRAWTSERCAPDLLPYPVELLGRVMERVQAQIARIEDLAAGAAEGVGGGSGSGSGGNVNLVLSILQTDLSRTQFLVRSLLRQRLAKVTRFAGYYASLLEGDQRKEDVVEGGTAAGGLLSATEAQFLRRHQVLLKGFYEGSFLSGFPAKLRKLDDGGTGEGGMLEGPDRLSVVVVRCLKERWGNEELVDDTAEEATTLLEMERGQVWVVRWADVRSGVLDGSLEVL